MRHSTTAPYARGNEASREAADGIQHKLEGIRASVFDHIVSCYDIGATNSEIAHSLRMSKDTTQPRSSELRDNGYIVDSGRLRKNPKGKNETVWLAKADHPRGEWPGRKSKDRGEEFSGGLQAFDHVLLLRPDIAYVFGNVALELIRHDLRKARGMK